MRILLVSPNREEINMRTWPLGLACVAAATSAAGHQVKVIDFMGTRDPHSCLRKAFDDFRPEIIGLSVRNIDDQCMETRRFLLEEARDIVAECRNLSEAPIVLGGAGYSIFPEPLLEYLAADMGIQGEGEAAFCELVRRLEHSEDPRGLPGLYLAGKGAQGRRIFVKDLDRFPLPGPSAFTPDASHDDFWLPVQTRRGCPLNCSYCSTSTIEGSFVRKRSADRVLRWLSDWVKAGLRRFYFVDNTFNLPPSYAKSLCSLLADALPDIAWRCILYPGKIDEELVKLMAAAGCQEVSLGFESGSSRILDGMNKRFNPDDVRTASNALADHGIRRMGFLMLGGPAETKESVQESLAFADSLNLDLVKVTVGIRIYPYTALARAAVEEGLIAREDNLLVPRFYVTQGLEQWLKETVSHWMGERSNWIA
jgi:radical SAM superfamily enzyme YgiQ (UPF0313 family)